MKSLIYITTLFILMLSSQSFSQVTARWSSVYNGKANDTDIAKSMAVDNSGNVYVTGYSIGNNSAKDFATVKYNSAGDEIWVQRYNNINENADDVATGVAVDASGNVYVTGYSFSKNTLDDYLTLKYSQSGDLLWMAKYNGKGNDEDISSSVAVDGLGNVYVTGYSVGAVTSEDYATIKYNSAGIQQWIRTYNNELMDDIDIATSLALDGSGNIYVTGYSVGISNNEDFATIKYNSSGDEIWAVRYNGPGDSYDITSALAVDKNENVYVTGYSYGDGTSEDYATIKYNSTGTEQWVRRYNGSSNDFDIATALFVDNQENVYVTGYSYDSISYENYATIKYNSDGISQWTSIYNGEGNDFDIASAVKADNNGNIYVTGYTYTKTEEENFATVKYDANGNQLWVEIYNGKANGSDISSTLEITESGDVFVSGYSLESGTGLDYITLKYSQTVGINLISNSSPGGFYLNQNYPNPFNPVTNLEFGISRSGFVTLKIYNMLGKEVSAIVNSDLNPGTYKYNFDASVLTSGIYYYTLKVSSPASTFSETKKMLLVK